MQSLFCIVVLFLYGVVGISLRAPSSVVAGDAIQISWRRGRRDDRVFGLRFRSADFEGEMSRVDSRGDDDGIERIVAPNRAGNYVVEAITGDRFPTFSNIIRVQARPEVPPTPPAPVPLPPPTVPSNGSAPGGVRPEPTPGPGNEQPEEDMTLSTTRSDTIQSTSSPPRPTPTSASSDSDKARVSATSSQPTSLETANAAVLPTNRSDPAPPLKSVAPDATISGNTSKSSKSNAGMIAGIVIAVLLVLGILFFVLIRARRRQRKRHTNVFFNDKMVSNGSHRTGLTSISAPPGSNRSLAGTTGHYYDSTASTPQPFLQEKRDVYLQSPHPYSQRPQSVNVEDAYSGYVDTEPAPPTAIYYSSQYPPSPSSPAIHAKSSSGQRLSEFKFPGPRS